MKDAIKKELRAIVGADGATDKPEHLATYSYDAYTEEHLPDIVLFPKSTDQVSAIMKIAHTYEIPVTPRGSGTNLAGESVPIRGGVVVCLARMDNILSIDAENRMATVQPGVINLDLQKAVEKHGLMYPPDPASWAVATMGGTVATNAGGPRTLKYGVTKDYLLGLAVVLADGRTLKTGGRTIKNVTGYNLTGLICGSEGTLGIITEIIVRLVAKPQASRTVRADFARIDDCSDAVAGIIGAGVIPASLELMDQFVVRAVDQAFGLGLPSDAEGVLLVQLDGNRDSIDSEAQQIERILREKHAANIIAASDAGEAERLWLARRSAGPALMRLRPNTITEDVTVPVSKLTAMLRKITEISARHNIPVGVMAHAGDGNLHPCIAFDKRDEEEHSRVKAVCDELIPAALALGGTLSGEHGIGIAKAPFLPLEMDDVALSIMRNVKMAFDPKGILNPGKFV
jgi:glycolate oxidase